MASSKSARGATNGVTNTTSIRSTNRSLMITSAQMMGPGLDASGRSGSPTPVGSARPTNPVGHWKIPVGLQCHCSNIVKLHDILSVKHTTSCPSPTRQLVGDPTDELSVEVGVGVGFELDVDGGRRRARTPLRGGVVPFASLSNPKPKTVGETPTPPSPVTLPEPLPLTPDETCAECGGYFLDCNHKSGTLSSPLVVGPPAPASPPTRAAFEVEEDFA